jgi:uroporphyrinogen-III synthase
VLDDLASYALVAFVSPNAIEAAFAHIERWPAGVDIAVVGEGSRAALAKHGVQGGSVRIHCPLDPARSDSEHLLQALDLARLAGRRVLVVRGEGGRELMPDALRGAGAAVETVAAYRRAVPALTPELARSWPACWPAERLDNHEFGSAARAGVAGGQLDPGKLQSNCGSST